MVIDTSAILAILGDEPERQRFNRLIAASTTRLMSVASYVEAGIVQRARRGPAGVHELLVFVSRAEIDLVPVDERLAQLALDAYGAFGRRLHPAGLNYGDCFVYALARKRNEPLLFKGGDFSKTDVEPAAP